MSLGCDEELKPFQEVARDYSDSVRIGKRDCSVVGGCYSAPVCSSICQSHAIEFIRGRSQNLN